MFEISTNSIKERDVSQNTHGVEIAPGMVVTWYNQGYANWYMNAHGTNSPSEAFDEGSIQLQQYLVGEELWIEGSIPSAWLKELAYIFKERKNTGTDDPLCVLSVIHLLLDNDRNSIASPLLNHGFGEEKEGRFELDLGEIARNIHQLKALINLFIGENKEEYLHSRFVKAAIDFMPIESVYGYNFFGFLIEKIVDEEPNPLIVDVGTGKGRMEYIAQGSSSTFFAVDKYYLPQVLEFDNRRLDNLHYVWADGYKLPFGDDSVDLVTMFGVLGHHSEESIQKMLRETCRVLKPGAKLLINLQENPEESNYIHNPMVKAINGCRLFEKQKDPDTGEWHFIEVDV